MGIRERLRKFIDYKGISRYKFYKDLGLSNGFLDKEGNIGSDKCEKIIYQYPDLNIIWLITGEGDMLYNSTKNHNVNQSIIGNNNISTGYGSIEVSGEKLEEKLILSQQLEEKNNQIKDLLIEQKKLQNTISKLQKQVDILINKLK
ncbi:hypothetical protein [Phocaeicola plebeius]|jgi:hypothetical protein|uniref:Uncharacterized protein n=1 Tax=Myoviridae sp. ctAbS6 TaxID=2826628 RepID=A0A8S5M748_9CAUD|nr:MAG TPA: hypothetical protein [Myoviridae sp. ctAbS6]DAV51826.1 MAG TPA: hypothetical protein [Caudoviricetes sp.]